MHKMLKPFQNRMMFEQKDIAVGGMYRLDFVKFAHPATTSLRVLDLLFSLRNDWNILCTCMSVIKT